MYFANIQPYVKRQVIITFFISFGQMILGYSLYWTAPVIPKLENIQETPLDRVVSTTESSWIASLVYFGFFGSISAGYVTNIIGRRPCLVLGGVCNLFSYIILTFSTTIVMIYVARFLVAFSINFSLVSSLTYLGEIASPNIRGILLSTTGVFQSFGGFLVYCVGPYTSYQGIGYIIIGVSAVCAVSNYFLPESPLYHVMKDNQDAAKESLRILGRDKKIETELKNMTDLAKEIENNVYIWKELFKEKRNQRALFITVPLFISQQCSGVMAVSFFATNIFKSAGSSLPPHICTIIIGATSLLSSVFSTMFVDKYGRKILLIISTAGCCVSVAILGVFFYLDKIGNPSVMWLRWLPLVCLILALFSYTIGLSIIPSTLAGEMFSPNVRGLGASISLFAGLVSGFITTTIFGYIVISVGIHVTFWIFAVINAIALTFVIVFVPETKGKTLNEIGIMMAK